MMPGSLLIDHQEACQRVALLDAKNQLQGLWVMSAKPSALQPGAIVSGTITQRHPALKAATVRIAGHGDVQIKGRDVPKPSAPEAMQLQITAAGQVSRHPAVPAKLPRASASIAWPGRGLVYLPDAPSGITISKRAQGVDQHAIAPVLAGYPGQWVIRQRAVTMSDGEIRAAAEAIHRQAMAFAASAADARGIQYPAQSAIMSALVDMPASPEDLSVFTADPEAEAALDQAKAALGLKLANTVTREAVFADLDIEQAIEGLRDPVISGDDYRLVIEPTEAFISIDVDLSSPAALDAAITACWRQIALRNLSGQILIDLPRQTDWGVVKERFERLSHDHAEAVQVKVMPGPGIVGLSIQRRRPMLHEVLGADHA